MASEKKTVTRVRMNTLKAVATAATAVPAKPTKAPKKSKPATASKLVAKTMAMLPAVVGKAGKQLAADAKGVPGSKRTVVAPENGLSGVPVHKVRTIAELAKLLGDFPRGSTFSADQYFGKGRIFIYNLRGKLIAEVRQDDKPKKTARADKL